ncbi:hypothetical protein [Clostridium sp.]|uniref:hypothetical protein n=1 Tax=Clostridium sp. TaxID=1506 RepID=UPI00284A5B49|nr:hypothetical protein [Clostridium sp.]MDR3597167.1 hypothetical protein [Clostridium sp.]
MSKKFNPYSYKNRFKKYKGTPGVLNKGKDDGHINEPTIFCNHTGEFCLNSLILFPNLPQFIQVAFIDPGKVSCGIRIVRYYIVNGFIEVMWFGIHNFGIGMEQIIIGVENELNPILEKLRLCHHIVIESQFMKCEINFRTFQHMVSYIESSIRNQGMRPLIFEVDRALKTVFIGGPRTKNQYGGTEIKEWSKAKAREEFLKRGDHMSYAILVCSCSKQNEDLSDTACYEIAWWGYMFEIKHLLIKITWLYELLK